MSHDQKCLLVGWRCLAPDWCCFLAGDACWSVNYNRKKKYLTRNKNKLATIHYREEYQMLVQVSSCCPVWFEAKIQLNYFQKTTSILLFTTVSKVIYPFILCNFLVQTLQCFQIIYFFFLTLKTWKNHPKKLLIIGPIFFFRIANRPKSSPNLNSCSIKIV